MIPYNTLTIAGTNKDVQDIISRLCQRYKGLTVLEYLEIRGKNKEVLV